MILPPPTGPMMVTPMPFSTALCHGGLVVPVEKIVLDQHGFEFSGIDDLHDIGRVVMGGEADVANQSFLLGFSEDRPCSLWAWPCTGKHSSSTRGCGRSRYNRS